MSDSIVNIQIKGLEELMRIASFNLGPVMRQILHEVGGLVKKEISRAPGKVHLPIAWVSDKQRKAYFAKRRLAGPFMKGGSAAMQMGPWVRETDPQSEKLLASWEVTDENDYRVKVHTSVSYGPWVQSADHQQPFHANTGWRTDEGVLQYVAMSREVERIAGAAIGHVLEGR